jgi:hypothetical protein
MVREAKHLTESKHPYIKRSFGPEWLCAEEQLKG